MNVLQFYYASLEEKYIRLVTNITPVAHFIIWVGYFPLFSLNIIEKYLHYCVYSSVRVRILLRYNMIVGPHLQWQHLAFRGPIPSCLSTKPVLFSGGQE